MFAAGRALDDGGESFAPFPLHDESRPRRYEPSERERDRRPMAQ